MNAFLLIWFSVGFATMLWGAINDWLQGRDLVLDDIPYIILGILFGPLSFCIMFWYVWVQARPDEIIILRGRKKK